MLTVERKREETDKQRQTAVKTLMMEGEKIKLSDFS